MRHQCRGAFGEVQTVSKHRSRDWSDEFWSARPVDAGNVRARRATRPRSGQVGIGRDRNNRRDQPEKAVPPLALMTARFATHGKITSVTPARRERVAEKVGQEAYRVDANESLGFILSRVRRRT